MRASELKRAKRDVRRSVLAARDAVGEAERIARSTAIHRRFLALREVEDVGVVMGFWSFGSEVSTPPLLEALHARGVRSAYRGSTAGAIWRRSPTSSATR